jgi:serine/threonine protein kinase
VRVNAIGMGKRKMSKRARSAKNQKDKRKMKCVKLKLKQRIVAFTMSMDIQKYTDIVRAFSNFRIQHSSEPLVRKMGLQSFCDPLKHLFVVKHKTRKIVKTKTLNERIVHFAMEMKKNLIHSYNDITSVYQQFRDANRNEILIQELDILTFCHPLEPFFIIDHAMRKLQLRVSLDGMELISSGADGVIFKYKGMGLKVFFTHAAYVHELIVSTSIGQHKNIRSLKADNNFYAANAVFFKFCQGDAHFANWCDDENVDIINFIQQVSGAMLFMHEKGFAHNDLKPGNIMYDHGSFFVSDFSRAFRLTHLTSLQKLNNVGHFRGTKGYSAPELDYSHTMPSESTDVYSFGKTVERILTSAGKGKRRAVPQYILNFIRNDVKLWCSKQPKRRPSFQSIFNKYKDYKNASSCPGDNLY